MNPIAFLKIIRLPNLLILGASVALGFWLSHSALNPSYVFLLIIAAMATAGFGNTINDIADVKTDCISHPNRPLPKKEMTLFQAWIFAVFLVILALTAAFLVSRPHCIGVIVPLCLLTLYAIYLKGTPLIGNILVSALVGYGPIFGGLGAPTFERLLIPAILAFLLNMTREIIKDIQDENGDRAAGITTSASLSSRHLKIIILLCGILYGILVFLPFVFGFFGIPYVLLCIIIVLPLHVYWMRLFLTSNWQISAKKISLLIKIELACGLLALATDELLKMLK